MVIKINGTDRKKLLKRIFFLLYEAAGSPRGMGILQARSDATEEDVWRNVRRMGDYPGDFGKKEYEKGRVYADYVFGRMVKWGIELRKDEDELKIVKEEFDPEYNGFFSTYKNNQEILDAAFESLGVRDGYKVINESK